MFLTGVAYDHARMIAEDDGEHLLSLSFGDSVDVFYADGRVVRYMHNGEVEKIPLSADIQAHLRCENALARFARASSLTGDARVKAEDRALHEIAAVIKVGGVRSEAALLVAYEALVTIADEHALRPNVYYHVKDALRQVSAMHLHLFTNDYRVGQKPARNDTATPTEKLVRATNLKERERRKRERAAHDRKERAAMRGGNSSKKEEKKRGKKR